MLSQQSVEVSLWQKTLRGNDDNTVIINSVIALDSQQTLQFPATNSKCLDNVQISEHFQTNQVLQQYQDSGPDIPSGPAESDRMPLRPREEKHFKCCQETTQN